MLEKNISNVHLFTYINTGMDLLKLVQAKKIIYLLKDFIILYQLSYYFVFQIIKVRKLS